MKLVFLCICFLFAGTTTLLKAQIDSLCPTDIEEIEAHSLLSVFPNPTTGYIKITYASTTECPPAGWGGTLHVNIINENGKTVFSETIYDFEDEYIREVDLSKEFKGLYIIEVIAGRQKRVVREVLD